MDHKENILFSIIIPTYNRGHMIGRAIESVLGQTYPHWELIIVDDGSADNTAEVVAGYDDQRIRYYHKKNEERSIARNYGIDRAKGLYIGFLDDDDYYLQEFLMEFRNTIIEKGKPIALLVCNHATSSDGIITHQKINKNYLNNASHFLWHNGPIIEAYIVHRDILNKERFDQKLKYGEDIHLFQRISFKYPLVLVDKVLCVNTSHKKRSTLLRFEENLNENFEQSYAFIHELQRINPSLFDSIPKNKFFDFANHTTYGFASAAMKKGDFLNFLDFVRKFKKSGSKLKLLYYLASLFGRLPFYIIKSLFK